MAVSRSLRKDPRTETETEGQIIDFELHKNHCTEADEEEGIPINISH